MGELAKKYVGKSSDRKSLGFKESSEEGYEEESEKEVEQDSDEPSGGEQDESEEKESEESAAKSAPKEEDERDYDDERRELDFILAQKQKELETATHTKNQSV